MRALKAVPHQHEPYLRFGKVRVWHHMAPNSSLTAFHAALWIPLTKALNETPPWQPYEKRTLQGVQNPTYNLSLAQVFVQFAEALRKPCYKVSLDSLGAGFPSDSYKTQHGRIQY